MARLIADPLDELVAQEPYLAPAGEPMCRDSTLSDHLAQILDMNVKHLGRHDGGENLWFLSWFVGHGVASARWLA